MLETDENPYRFPPALLSFDGWPAIEGAERFESGRGSVLAVAARRWFDERFLRASTWASWVTLFVPVFPITVVVMGLGREHGFVWMLVAGSAFALLGMLFSPFMLLRGPPAIAAGPGTVPTEVAFVPRLSGSRRELRAAPADDLGYSWLEGSRWCFRGDRCEIDLERTDISVLRQVWTANGFLHAWSPELEIGLREPLGGRTRLRVLWRDAARTPATPLRAWRMRRALRCWLANDGSRG